MTSTRMWTNQILFVLISVLSAVATAGESDNSQTTTAQPQRATDLASQTSIDDSDTVTDQTELIEQCHHYAQSLMSEKERLRTELDAIKLKLEAVAIQDMQEEANDSNESHSRSRGIRRSRGKRGSGCEGGTVSQWACGSQCIFKLKGLCGLSLRAMCHC